MVVAAAEMSKDENISTPKSFFLQHVKPVLVNTFRHINVIRLMIFFFCIPRFAPDVTFNLVCWCAFSTCYRCFMNNAGGHRYLGHLSFHCHPILAWIMCVSISTGDIGPILYWPLLHESDHHLKCEQEGDLSSPYDQGFWPVQFSIVPAGHRDIMMKALAIKKPLLKNKYDIDVTVLMDLRVNAAILIGENLLWILLAPYFGFSRSFELWFWVNYFPKVWSQHAIRLINSFSHMYGTRPYTGNGRPPFGECMATNSWFVTIVGFGEGWHNNHHAFSKSARQGLLWWEFDATWQILRLLAMFGLVYDMIEVSDELKAAPRYEPLPNVGHYKMTYEKKKTKKA